MELVWATLRELNYSLQGNRKMEEGNQHPDRDAQFEHINAVVARAIRKGEPVISVDTKKRELVGNYKNEGRKWHRKGESPRVQGHDFPQPHVPRAFRTESTIWHTIPVMSLSALITTPGSSPLRRFAAGGERKDAVSIARLHGS